ncbi:hypothetical protein O3M35_012299 [Rhynocoris fuscipes]|uniref:Signal recognition particle receptor subunit beta n=1 Tax=Rhynocoris fuscipes TaxID=488301 RepID=A0AAW1CXM8_9HEMI
MDQDILNIIVAVCVVLLTLVFYLLFKWSKTSRRTILITGVCDSGKTLIFTRLVHDRFAKTHTSIRENASNYLTDKGTNIQLVDIPGHERLRNSYLDDYKKSARGIIYVIDSLTLNKEIKDVAEYLYTLLTDEDILKNCKNILIFCNKQDNTTAKGAQILKSLLEKELNTVRETKSHSLENTEGTVDSVYLGIKGQEFEFAHCLPTIIDFAEGYALDSEGDESLHRLDPLKQWIAAIS